MNNFLEQEDKSNKGEGKLGITNFLVTMKEFNIVITG